MSQSSGNNLPERWLRDGLPVIFIKLKEKISKAKKPVLLWLYEG
jgi:hypothetical protein